MQPDLEPAGNNSTAADKPGAEAGQAKKKFNKKKPKRPADGAPASRGNPAKKIRTQSESKTAKKKNKPQQK